MARTKLGGPRSGGTLTDSGVMIGEREATFLKGIRPDREIALMLEKLVVW